MQMLIIGQARKTLEEIAIGAPSCGASDSTHGGAELDVSATHPTVFSSTHDQGNTRVAFETVCPAGTDPSRTCPRKTASLVEYGVDLDQALQCPEVEFVWVAYEFNEIAVAVANRASEVPSV